METECFHFKTALRDSCKTRNAVIALLTKVCFEEKLDNATRLARENKRQQAVFDTWKAKGTREGQRVSTTFSQGLAFFEGTTLMENVEKLCDIWEKHASMEHIFCELE